MTGMSSQTGHSDVAAAARVAGQTREQMHNFTNVSASMAMEGMPLTLDELGLGAELAAGRIDFAEHRRRLGV